MLSEPSPSESLSEIIRSLFVSSKFRGFTRGVTVELPTGQQIALKIESIQRLPDGLAFRFLKNVYVTTMSSGEYTELGYGEADFPLIAIQKSISEAVERVLYRVLKGSSHGTQNTSGWAAHLNRELAKKAALQELLERDAVLAHWLCEIPFQEIRLDTCPAWIQSWAQRTLTGSPYPELRILVSHCGYIPTLSAALVAPTGAGVISHAASQTLEGALSKALSETCALARNAAAGKIAGAALRPAAYGYQPKLPDWIFGQKFGWGRAVRSWKGRARSFSKDCVRSEFHEIVSAPISVGYCTSPDVQNLFFGRTQDAIKSGFINLKRLNNLSRDGESKAYPHFVA